MFSFSKNYHGQKIFPTRLTKKSFDDRLSPVILEIRWHIKIDQHLYISGY